MLSVGNSILIFQNFLFVVLILRIKNHWTQNAFISKFLDANVQNSIEQYNTKLFATNSNPNRKRQRWIKSQTSAQPPQERKNSQNNGQNKCYIRYICAPVPEWYGPKRRRSRSALLYHHVREFTREHICTIETAWNIYKWVLFQWRALWIITG